MTARDPRALVYARRLLRRRRIVRPGVANGPSAHLGAGRSASGARVRIAEPARSTGTHGQADRRSGEAQAVETPLRWRLPSDWGGQPGVREPGAPGDRESWSKPQTSDREIALAQSLVWGRGRVVIIDPPLVHVGGFPSSPSSCYSRHMRLDQIEIIRGSGNVYQDLNIPDANVRQCKAILAAKIMKVLSKSDLSVQSAERLTGGLGADLARIRTADLERFTTDRLIAIRRLLTQAPLPAQPPPE